MLKNITLSAEKELIQQAREKAQREHTTLNAQFRFWLKRYVDHKQIVAEYTDLMNELRYVSPGRKFNRNEMNER